MFDFPGVFPYSTISYVGPYVYNPGINPGDQKCQQGYRCLSSKKQKNKNSVISCSFYFYRVNYPVQ